MPLYQESHVTSKVTICIQGCCSKAHLDPSISSFIQLILTGLRVSNKMHIHYKIYKINDKQV